MNPFFLTDAYKVSHPEQYPPGTEYVYSNVTARTSRIPGVDHIVVFGIQYFIEKYLIQNFYRSFFRLEKSAVLAEIDEFYESYFGTRIDLSRIGRLHDLGYLPLKIKCLPEGTHCPIGVPFMTIVNTDPEFYWITNFIETLCQNTIWNPITAATIANRYRKLFEQYAEETCDDASHVPFQGHNFGMRGMSSLESSMTTDGGHLLSFIGSDTLAGNAFMREYYDADGVVSMSVPATEHAVMCTGGREDERETFRRLIQDVYPSGIVSIVSDTWNLWDVLSEIAPSLKGEIEARDGKVVFRPDSGDPEKIICGYCPMPKSFSSSEALEKFSSRDFHERAFFESDSVYCDDHKIVTQDGHVIEDEREMVGCLRLLDNKFGSTVNSKGYRVLNPKVGLIYGDSITFDRAKSILRTMRNMRYASSNIVLGIGSFTYQYNTRDTFGIACKATWAQVNGVQRNIYKDPVTDDGTKKSACGLLRVYEGEDGRLTFDQEVTPSMEADTILRTVFLDGVMYSRQDLGSIRDRIRFDPLTPSATMPCTRGA